MICFANRIPLNRDIVLIALLVIFQIRIITGQEFFVVDNDDWTSFFQTEARLKLGESGLSVHPSLTYVRDNNFSTYAGTFAGLGIFYETKNGFKFWIDETYVSLPDALTGNLLQLEAQKMWGKSKLKPLLRLTVGQLYLEDIRIEERVLLNYRTRIRVGIVPKIGRNTSLFLMNEWFPTQKAGFSKENRILTGFTHDFNPRLSLVFAHILRYRDNDVSAIQWQNIVFLGLVYKGVLNGRN